MFSNKKIFFKIMFFLEDSLNFFLKKEQLFWMYDNLIYVYIHTLNEKDILLKI